MKEIENKTGYFNSSSMPNRLADFVTYKKSILDYEKFLIRNQTNNIEISYDYFLSLDNVYFEIKEMFWLEKDYLYRFSEDWSDMYRMDGLVDDKDFTGGRILLSSLRPIGQLRLDDGLSRITHAKNAIRFVGFTKFLEFNKDEVFPDRIEWFAKNYFETFGLRVDDDLIELIKNRL